MKENIGLTWHVWLASSLVRQAREIVWHLISETRLVREGSSRKRWVTFSRCGAELFFLYDVTPTDWVAGRWCQRCEQCSPAPLNMLAWAGAIA